MKKKIYLLFIIFIPFLSANSQSVDEIIDNYAEAIGGADKLLAVNSVKFTGTIAGNGTDISVTIIVKRNGKARQEQEYQGMKLITACDGKTGWIVNPFSGTRDADMLPPEDVKTLRKLSEIEGELINYKEKGYKAEFLEKDDFEGSEVYKIKLTDNDGDVTYYFIDVDTSFLLMSKNKRKIGEKEVISETVYGNYQNFNGIMLPMSIELRASGSDSGQKMNFVNVEFNVVVDDSIFKVPAAN